VKTFGPSLRAGPLRPLDARRLIRCCVSDRPDSAWLLCLPPRGESLAWYSWLCQHCGKRSGSRPEGIGLSPVPFFSGSVIRTPRDFTALFSLWVYCPSCGNTCDGLSGYSAIGTRGRCCSGCLSPFTRLTGDLSSNGIALDSLGTSKTTGNHNRHCDAGGN